MSKRKSIVFFNLKIFLIWFCVEWKILPHVMCTSIYRVTHLLCRVFVLQKIFWEVATSKLFRTLVVLMLKELYSVSSDNVEKRKIFSSILWQKVICFTKFCIILLCKNLRPNVQGVHNFFFNIIYQNKFYRTKINCSYKFYNQNCKCNHLLAKLSCTTNQPNWQNVHWDVFHLYGALCNFNCCTLKVPLFIYCLVTNILNL